jgi:flavin-dependent dehydrogenase
MKTVKILGGGIAGLTAAITLRKAGFEPEVHELKGFCGKDFQFLENWTFDKDPIEYLRSIGIKTGLKNHQS